MKMITSLFFTISIVALILGIISQVLPLFNLPGDFIIRSKQLVFMFPLATSILLSMIASLVMRIFYKP